MPTLLEATKDADAGVRIAALAALGQLAGPEGIAKLAHLILDAKDAAAREEAEKALVLVAQRDPKVRFDRRALPLLKVMSGLNEKEKTTLLPALGRIGGKPALKVIDAALPDKDPARHAAALQALCNWPDGSVAPRLVEFALAANDPADRMLIVNALIRVAPLPDRRPDAVRLAMLKRAMELAGSDQQKALVLKRARAIYSLDTLRFVAPYMDQPAVCADGLSNGRRAGPSQGVAAAEQGRVRQGPRQGDCAEQGPGGDFAGEALSEGPDLGGEAAQGEMTEHRHSPCVIFSAFGR